MSSFRPDSSRAPLAFVPSLFGGAASDFVAGGPLGGAPCAVGVTSAGGDPEPPTGSPRVVGPAGAGAQETPSGGAAASEAAAREAAASEERLAALEQEAFERGVASARAGNERLESLCDALEGALRPLRRSGATWLAVQRECLLDLAITIAERWVGRALREDAGLLAEVLDRAIDRLGPEAPVGLWLAPQDLACLEERAAARVAHWREDTGVRVEADPALASGEYRLEGPDRSIDGRLEAISETLRDVLVEALEAPAPAEEVVSGSATAGVAGRACEGEGDA